MHVLGNKHRCRSRRSLPLVHSSKWQIRQFAPEHVPNVYRKCSRVSHSCNVRVPFCSTSDRFPATKGNTTEHNGTPERNCRISASDLACLSTRPPIPICPGAPLPAQLPELTSTVRAATILSIQGVTTSAFNAPTYLCFTMPSLPMKSVTGRPTTP